MNEIHSAIGPFAVVTSADCGTYKTVTASNTANTLSPEDMMNAATVIREKSRSREDFEIDIRGNNWPLKIIGAINNNEFTINFIKDSKPIYTISDPSDIDTIIAYFSNA